MSISKAVFMTFKCYLHKKNRVLLLEVEIEAIYTKASLLP